MIRKCLYFLIAIGFMIGLGIFLYPQINEWLINDEINDAITKFEVKANDLKDSKLLLEMQTYNQQLCETGQNQLKDAWNFEESKLDFKDDVIATIKIPKMSIDLPIYVGASKEKMAKGIVNLAHTSLPIGGINTNCVLAGHRGYRGAPFFIDIEKLVLGDEVIIQNYWEELVYQVSSIKVIYPDQSDQILIQSEKDMITLITCHPYRNNYQRYLVYCTRANSNIKTTVDTSMTIASSKKDIWLEKVLFWIGIIWIIMFFIVKHRKLL